MKIRAAILAVLFAMVLSFSASACDSNGDDNAAYNNADTESWGQDILDYLRSEIDEE